jgi:hypothetical protein
MYSFAGFFNWLFTIAVDLKIWFTLMSYEKLIFAHFVKKFSRFYGIHNILIVFERNFHSFLP